MDIGGFFSTKSQAEDARQQAGDNSILSRSGVVFLTAPFNIGSGVAAASTPSVTETAAGKTAVKDLLPWLALGAAALALGYVIKNHR